LYLESDRSYLYRRLLSDEEEYMSTTEITIYLVSF
jgi:hypothetical protein